MKNLLFGLIALVFFSTNVLAQEEADTKKGDRVESAFFTLKVGDSNTEYKYKTIKEFSENTDQILESLQQDIKTGKIVLPDDNGGCMVTITMSVTVTANASIGLAGGSISTTVTGSITVSCDDVVSGGRRLRLQLIAAAGG